MGEKVALLGLLVALEGNGWPELAVEMGVRPLRENCWRAEVACQGDDWCGGLLLLLLRAADEGWGAVLLKVSSWEEGVGRPLIDTARTLEGEGGG